MRAQSENVGWKEWKHRLGVQWKLGAEVLSSDTLTIPEGSENSAWVLGGRLQYYWGPLLTVDAEFSGSFRRLENVGTSSSSLIAYQGSLYFPLRIHWTANDFIAPFVAYKFTNFSSTSFLNTTQPESTWLRSSWHLPVGVQVHWSLFSLGFWMEGFLSLHNQMKIEREEDPKKLAHISWSAQVDYVFARSTQSLDILHLRWEEAHYLWTASDQERLAQRIISLGGQKRF